MNIKDLDQLLASFPPLDNQVPATLTDKFHLFYAKAVFSEIKKIFSSEKDDLYGNLEKFLNINWSKIKGTVVSYTSIPNDPATKILIMIAELVAEHKNETEQLNIMPIELLMPGLQLESQSDDYISLKPVKSFYSWDETKEKELVQLQNITNDNNCGQINANPSSNSIGRNYDDIVIQDPKIQNRLRILQEEKNGYYKERLHYFEKNEFLIPIYDLQIILKTSILSSKYNSLIPIKTLLTKEHFNPYSVEFEKITSEEYSRIINHSDLTMAVNESRESLNKLQLDASNLLSHLTVLCKKLRINDAKEGVGQEQNAGGGAYSAIISFNDYYNSLSTDEKNKIPKDLYDEIKLLLQLSSDPHINNSATKNLDTCIATRRNRLEQYLKKYALKLAEIACSEVNKLKMIHEKEKDVILSENKLLVALESNNYKGSDKSSITLELIDYLNIEISILSLQDLKVLMTLPASELKIIIERNSLNTSLSFIFKTIEELIVFINEYPVEKLIVFFDATKSFLIQNLIKNSENLHALLASLSADKFKVVFNIFKKEKLIFWNTTRILHYFCNDFKFIKLIQEQLTEAEYIEALRELNPSGETILHSFALEPDVLKILLEVIPKEKRITAVQERNLYTANTVLHQSITHLQSVKILIELLPEDDLFNLATQFNKYGYTLFHFAAKFPEAITLLLNAMSPDKYFQIITTKNIYRNMVIFYAAAYPASLKFMLSLLTYEQIVQVINEKNLNNNTLLHEATICPESLQFLIDLLKKDDFDQAVKAKNNLGNSVIFQSFSNFESFKILLKYCRSEERINLLKEKNNHGCSILSMINSRSLELIIKMLPSKSCVDVELFNIIEKSSLVNGNLSELIFLFYLKCLDCFLNKTITVANNSESFFANIFPSETFKAILNFRKILADKISGPGVGLLSQRHKHILLQIPGELSLILTSFNKVTEGKYFGDIDIEDALINKCI